MRSRFLSAVALTTLGCATNLHLARNDADVVLAHQSLDAPNPSMPGRFTVRHTYYGSGTDVQRVEFRDSAAIKTKPVDASPFVSIAGAQAADRKKYWGFDTKKFPVNGRVWYPEGAGPFPLVLVVHGNHDWKDFSDPGYAYLGELLASRGYIFVSVDENFINGLSGENDGRAWMLLQHLAAWKGFNADKENPFFGQVDMHAIALMGHSRGGEAIAGAAAFNRLSQYPDDGKVKFDFGFDIKSLIAIAPVDGQYRPADQYVPIDNVNYLVLHGSHDGDVSTFNGLRQYQRLRFTDEAPWFKTALYVYRANHGQWNTVWGNHDRGDRSGRSLQLDALMDAEEQRLVAKVYVAAFLDATLKGQREYLPMFRDHRTIGGWLPKTMYLTRFQEASFRTLASFEDDIDLASGTMRGVTLRGDSIATWRESVVPFRTQNSNQLNNAVWIGWNNHIAGADTTKLGAPASFSVTLADTLAPALRLGRASSLAFLLAPTDVKPGPRRAPRDSAKAAADSAAAAKPGAKPPPPPKDTAAKKPPAKDTTPVDLSIEVTDANGVSARLPLSRYGAVRRPLETHILRREKREKAAFTTMYEIVLQSYTIPLADFIAVSPSFDPARIRKVTFLFDRTNAGTVIIDDIGFSTAFTP